MESRNKVAHVNPYYSLISSAFSSVYNIGASIIRKILRKPSLPPDADAHKVESLFKDATFKKDDVTLGELTHHKDKIPLVKIYSPHPHLGPMAEAGLMVPYFFNFHTEYFRYLFALARFVKGPWNMSAVEFINREARERGLQLDSYSISFHYFLKELYGQTLEHNKTAPFYSQRSDGFNLEDVRVPLLFCEVEKGLGRASGCSTAVTERDGKKHMIRLLDWFTFGTFQKYQIKVIKPTRSFPNDQKPQCVFLFTVPGIPGAITAFNDFGLGVAYNEVGGAKENRKNKKGGWPGLGLTHAIAEECRTMQEANQLLETEKQPASEHNLIIVAKDGYETAQGMPHDGKEVVRFLDRNAVTTNHHVDEKGVPLSDSACIMGPVVGSLERSERMKAAVAEAKFSPRNVGKSTGTKDTVEVIEGSFDYQNKEYKLAINTANAYAPTAIDQKTNTLNYTTVNLVSLFREHERKVTETAKSVKRKMKSLEQDLAVDKSLIALIDKSNEVSQSHPVLAKELSDFYSALTERLAQCERFPQEASMSRETIQLVADRTVEATNAVVRDASDKDEKIDELEKLLSKKLPQRTLTYDKSRLVDALFVGCVCALFTQMMTSFIRGNVSPSIVETACEFFSVNGMTLLSANPAKAAASVLSVSLFLFKTPNIATSEKAVVRALRMF